MNHKEWMDMTIIEKRDLVGKLTHLLQNDKASFNAFKKHIQEAESLGLLNQIKFNENELHDNSGN